MVCKVFLLQLRAFSCFFRLRAFVVVALLSCVSLIAWKSCIYFFDTRVPQLSLSGVTEDAYVCGDVALSVASDKAGKISVWLDERPLTRCYEGIKPHQDYPFTIPTPTLTNGKHVLKIELTDNRYQKIARLSSVRLLWITYLYKQHLFNQNLIIKFCKAEPCIFNFK